MCCLSSSVKKLVCESEELFPSPIAGASTHLRSWHVYMFSDVIFQELSLLVFHTSFEELNIGQQLWGVLNQSLPSCFIFALMCYFPYDQSCHCLSTKPKVCDLWDFRLDSSDSSCGACLYEYIRTHTHTYTCKDTHMHVHTHVQTSYRYMQF